MPHTLSPTAHAAILQGATATAPNEACGLLLGAGTHIHTATTVTNVHPDPATCFEIDPAALIAAHRAARQGGPDLLGYWHSHPNGRAEPSPTDRAAASGDGRVWAIAAVDGAARGKVALWRDGANGFEPLPYLVRES